MTGETFVLTVVLVIVSLITAAAIFRIILATAPARRLDELLDGAKTGVLIEVASLTLIGVGVFIITSHYLGGWVAAGVLCVLFGLVGLRVSQIHSDR